MSDCGVGTQKTTLDGSSHVGGTAQARHPHRGITRAPPGAKAAQADQTSLCPAQTSAAGERAEFDFGEATVKLGEQLVKVPFLAGRLRYSGAMFVECFPTQRQEAFLLGQRHAFEFWGGVPRMVVYDNLKAAVLQVLKGHSRREHDVFQHFHSVYRFEALLQCACRVGERQCGEFGGLCAPQLPRAASRGH